MRSGNDIARTASPTQSASNGKGGQIVDKAIEFFNLYGYESVKVSDITDALHMGKGTFYLYFKNKKEVLLECFRRLGSLIRSLEDQSEVEESQDFFGRTRPRFLGFQERYERFSGILGLIRVATGSEDPQISECAKDSYSAIIEPLQTDLERAIQSGEIRNVDPELMIHALVGAVDRICYRATLDDRYTPAQLADFYQDFVERQFHSEGRIRAGTNTQHAPVRSWSVDLIGRDGVLIRVDQLRFQGENRICGTLGHAQIEADPAKIASINFRTSDAGCFAQIQMKDGQQASLQLDPDIQLSGETTLGTLRINVRNVASIEFTN